jgi:isopentenyl-diphosphate delta-isomerase type 1
MPAAPELLDVVDEHDTVIGHAPRPVVHARGLRHRAVHVWLFDRHGRLFVQQRAATKDTFPGAYDSSASGHVDRDEDYDACAVRELDEELGLTVPVTALEKLFKLPACAETGQEFVWVYRLRGDFQPAINREEIAAGAFWTRAQAQSVLPALCAPSFVRIAREFAVRHLWA